MPDKHATLSPSSAARWLACPPSVRLSEGLPNPSSPYAQEGTLAHSICEYLLKGKKIDKFKKDKDFSQGMLEYCTDYRAFVQKELNSMPNSALLVEQTYYIEGIDECFGTSDATLINNKILHVVDFKYGKGIEVAAEYNPQMMIYAIGAHQNLSLIYPDIETVRMTIYQPLVS